MGDFSQLDFVLENRDLIRGPIVEIGSKDYGNTNNFRSYFDNETYLGVDQEPGKGVDVICDFTSDFDSITRDIGLKMCRTVICLSVLEHCKHPFKMAENIGRLLANGGVLFVSVPFVWNIHAFPDDYWRFTPSSLPILFSDLQLLQERSYYSTKIRGEKLPLDAKIKVWGMTSKYSYTMFPAMVNGLMVKQNGS